MLRLPLVDSLSSVALGLFFQKPKPNHTICETLAARTLQWFGHVCRMPSESLIKIAYKEDEEQEEDQEKR